MKRTPHALVFLLIAGLSLAGEKAAEVPKLGAINAPLGGSVSSLPNASVGSLSIPQLPQSGVQTQAAPAQTASAPAQSAPAQSAASPANPPGPGPSQAAAPPAPPNQPPYFVEALVSLGAPRDLALQLAAYQEPRHPGDQGAIYHNLQHSRDVPNLTALSLKGPAGAGLSDRQKALLIVAAAFHDIDPNRPANTPASVTRTKAYLDADPESKALLEQLGARFGFTAAQATALIDATNFNPNPELQQKLDEEFRANAQAAFPGEEAAWALKWGRRLSLLDKSATYVSGPKSAERQVRGLANEMRTLSQVLTGKPSGPTDEQMVKGTPAFLKALRDDPDFELMLAPVKLEFLSVSKHFELKAQGLPSPYDTAPIANRGPPKGLFASAARDAAALGGAPVEAPAVAVSQDALQALSSSGWAVLPGEAILTAADAQYLLSRIDEKWPGEGSPLRTWDLIEGKNWRINRIHDEAMVAVVQRMVGRLTDMLNAATGEGLVPVEVQLRFGNDHPSGMHVDGGYITATLAIRGPGTLIFDELKNGGVNVVRAATGQMAIITNADRDFLTGVPGTVHSTPPPTDPKRAVFIIRFRAARTPELNGNVRQQKPYKDLEERNKRRVGAVARVIQAREPSKKPEATGLKGIWTKLFE